MFSEELRKLIKENRLARLATNGKDNFKVRNKLIRQLRKMEQQK